MEYTAVVIPYSQYGYFDSLANTSRILHKDSHKLFASGQPGLVEILESGAFAYAVLRVGIRFGAKAKKCLQKGIEGWLEQLGFGRIVD